MKDKMKKMVQNLMNKLDALTKGHAKVTLLSAAALVVVLVVIVVCATRNPLYKTYQIEDMLYISPLNSAHATLYEESFETVKLSGRKFEIVAKEETVTIKKPEIRTVEMTEELEQEISNALWGDTSKLDLTKIEKLYYIYDDEGKRRDYLLMETTDGMWFVKYYVVNEKMDIWHIFELD